MVPDLSCEALSDQVKVYSPPNSVKFFQFSNSCLSYSFQWLLITAAMVEIYILVVYEMHDGQALKNSLHSGLNTKGEGKFEKQTNKHFYDPLSLDPFQCSYSYTYI